MTSQPSCLRDHCASEVAAVRSNARAVAESIEWGMAARLGRAGGPGPGCVWAALVASWAAPVASLRCRGIQRGSAAFPADLILQQHACYALSTLADHGLGPGVDEAALVWCLRDAIRADSQGSARIIM